MNRQEIPSTLRTLKVIQLIVLEVDLTGGSHDRESVSIFSGNAEPIDKNLQLHDFMDAGLLIATPCGLS